MPGKVITQSTTTSDTDLIDMPEATDGIYTLAVKGAVPIKFVVMR